MDIPIKQSSPTLSARSLLAKIAEALPRGRPLPERSWRQRHIGLVVLLWIHVVALVIFGLLQGQELLHVLIESGLVGLAALGAGLKRFSQRVRSVIASMGLVTASAVLVHFSGGYVEFHFHFFIVVILLSLYQDWYAFLIALGYVVLHHGVVGLLDPRSVFNHQAAWDNPWLWALIHGIFVLGASVASVISWRLNEAARTETELILNAAGEGIWGLDLHGQTLFINPAGARMLGYSGDELLGRPIAELVMSTDDEESSLPWSEPARLPWRKTEQLAGEVLLRRRDGASLPVRYLCSPIQGYTGVNGMVVTFQDNSTRLHIEQQRRAELERAERALRETQRLEAVERETREQMEQAMLELQWIQEDERERTSQLEAAVSQFLAFLRQVSGGDLSVRLSQGYGGVLGQLGQGLNQMVESLQQITGQIRHASGQLSSTAGELLSLTQEQASSAAQQSKALVELMATVEEVRVIAAQTTERATQIVHERQAALLVAQQGTQVVQETIDGMAQIYEKVGGIAQTIDGLASQTQIIGTINTTVNELADQSNLLALNAAIEAARAGEQGKSFGVVAQHIRDLAERSKRATIQIREILKGIQGAMQNTIHVTEAGTEEAEAGVRRVGQTERIIQRMIDEVESAVQENIQIADSAREQMAGILAIDQTMGTILVAMEKILGKTTRADRAARELQTLAQSLQQAVTAYQL